MMFPCVVSCEIDRNISSYKVKSKKLEKDFIFNIVTKNAQLIEEKLHFTYNLNIFIEIQMDWVTIKANVKPLLKLLFITLDILH